MPMIWDDRLAEVWAAGKAGAGVVIGTAAVLTARHVVLGTRDRGNIEARVVRPGFPTVGWVPMTVLAEDEDWDVALLGVARGDAAHDEPGAHWLEPPSPSPVFVRLGSSAEPGCQAVGFPQSEVQGTPEGRTVRQSEQLRGTLEPAGQAKQPVNAERRLPKHWFPFDTDEPTPGTQPGWGGMSGAGVVLPDGRLVGLVVDAEASHQQRRLYVVPFANVLDQSSGIAEALSGVLGGPAVIEVRDAPRYKAVLKRSCLGPDGAPLPLAALEELDAFGVKAADLPEEPTYLDYVPRELDGVLRDALVEIVDARKMLLVVGGSAAGKSRSMAEAARQVLSGYRLLRPQYGSLSAVADLPLEELGAIVLWLDDVEHYTRLAFGDIVQTLLTAGAVAVGTIRREQLDKLTETGNNPAGAALTDPRLVSRVDWPMNWTLEERGRVSDHVANKALRRAVASGIPLGAWCVAGPQLLYRLRDAKGDDERPCRYALMRAAMDWYRTGIGRQPARDQIVELMNHAYLDEPATGDELKDALQWAVEPVIRAGRRSRHSLLALETDTQQLSINDYVQDHFHDDESSIPRAVWQAVVKAAGETPDVFPGPFEMGAFALLAGEYETTRDAWTALAESGNGDAMNGLGVLNSGLGDHRAARRWYERAAETGQLEAMYTLGKHLYDVGQLEAARRWWERAAANGDTASMNGLGASYMGIDTDAAQRWFEKAAAAGSGEAMNNLAMLIVDRDPRAAEQWWEKAAAAGNADAMLTLGARAGDIEATKRWWQQAAAAGNTRAMFGMGMALNEEGNHDEAQQWWEKAADAGDPDALNHLAALRVDGDPDEACRLWEKAARQGNAPAMMNLGALLVDSEPDTARYWWEQALQAGESTALDNLRARRDQLYRPAAENGDADAMNSLAYMLFDDDPSGARSWWEKAAKAGSIQAMCNLGRLLAESNPDAARGWYEKAAEAGDIDAMTNLVTLLAESDPSRARYWQEQAEAASRLAEREADGPPPGG
jgi:TPR repeat protein